VFAHSHSCLSLFYKYRCVNIFFFSKFIPISVQATPSTLLNAKVGVATLDSITHHILPRKSLSQTRLYRYLHVLLSFVFIPFLLPIQSPLLPLLLDLSAAISPISIGPTHRLCYHTSTACRCTLYYCSAISLPTRPHVCGPRLWPATPPDTTGSTTSIVPPLRSASAVHVYGPRLRPTSTAHVCCPLPYLYYCVDLGPKCRLYFPRLPSMSAAHVCCLG
jgi:hypothetical protein